MRLLPLLIVACLTGCATRLTLISPPVRADLLESCGDVIAEPLTTGDQYDTSRALVEATSYAKKCRARQDALVDAVKSRDQLMKSVQDQLKK